MRYIEFESKNFTDKSLEMIEKIDDVLKDYNAQGYVITLRQLYYRLFSSGVIKVNSEREYKKLIHVVNNARIAGLLPWDMIEDTAREYNSVYSNEDRAEAVRGVEQFYQVDMWARQDYYVEVWVEKSALGNVIERACEPYRVPHMSCRGYLSASQSWRAGERFEDQLAPGSRTDHERTGVLIYLGDHDPSGIDMTRDNERRLLMFSNQSNIKVRRIALNMNQVRQYNPIPNPTKQTDSRTESYNRLYGQDCWELDALEPAVIEALIVKEIQSLIDYDRWNDALKEQAAEQKLLSRVYSDWPKVEKLLEKLK